MLGLVKVRYYKAPTICLYLVELEYRALDRMVNAEEGDEEVSTNLHDDMHARRMISIAYFY